MIYTVEPGIIILAISPNIAIHLMDFATRSMKTTSTFITHRSLDKYTVSEPLRSTFRTNFF